ncbi:MAG: hypothetical protein NC123_18940 [Butyrivibrio sp.]|nr:hypothetical protein [Acetatifactor muris]MCM1561589.1 hypothetical protein [Butyrivibrio sp.]
MKSQHCGNCRYYERIDGRNETAGCQALCKMVNPYGEVCEHFVLRTCEIEDGKKEGGADEAEE